MSTTSLTAPARTLREWLHKRKWVRKNKRMLDDADALLISHTKSGRTWLRVMISHLYHLKYGLPQDELLIFDNFHRANPEIPRIFFFRDTRIPTFLWGNHHIPIPRTKKTLFLVRDPRDVAVSFYFHVRNRASRRELSRKGISEAARNLSIYAFVTDPQLGVPRIIEHFNRWRREMDSMETFQITRYEDLKENPATTLAKVIQFLDRPFSNAEIVKAVDFASFDNLKRKEKDGYFKTGRLAATNPDNEDTHKVRKGKIGGYKEYFTEEQNGYLNQLVREHLDPVYRYT